MFVVYSRSSLPCRWYFEPIKDTEPVKDDESVKDTEAKLLIAHEVKFLKKDVSKLDMLRLLLNKPGVTELKSLDDILKKKVKREEDADHCALFVRMNTGDQYLLLMSHGLGHFDRAINLVSEFHRGANKMCKLFILRCDQCGDIHPVVTEINDKDIWVCNEACMQQHMIRSAALFKENESKNVSTETSSTDVKG